MKLIIGLLLGGFIYNVLVCGAPELKLALLAGGLIGAAVVAEKGLKREQK